MKKDEEAEDTVGSNLREESSFLKIKIPRTTVKEEGSEYLIYESSNEERNNHLVCNEPC